MQKQLIHLDGTTKGIWEVTGALSPQDMINQCVENSLDEGGCHVIFGERLEDGPTREIYHIVASAGVLLCQNLLDPE